MEELKKEFDKLNAELALQNCSNREEKLSRMREILKEICKDQNFTADNIIDSMERQELIKLDGTLNRIQGQQNRDEINKLARNAQIGMSEYGPENPYPNN
ncbi:MAG: hypothetical protein UH077_04595 [Bacteroidales bacterium]|nr:hypothetical protein [Bacteroidales bacterium]